MSEGFSHHEPCAACGSKDNVGVWKDGHKYCFGCGWKSGGSNIKSLRYRLTVEEQHHTNEEIDISGYTSILPKEATDWLAKYRISPQLARQWGMMWNPKTTSLAFVTRNGEGQAVLSNERYFGKGTMPKYLTYGEKTKYMSTVAPTKNSYPGLIVLVEDYISALRVGAYFYAAPLYGSTIPINMAASLGHKYKHIRVWLDRDKASEAVLEASRASQFVKGSCRSIITDEDPKAHSDDEITEIVLGSFKKAEAA